MQFIDQANIILKAGKGGSIILVADNNLQTLLDFKFNREIFAKDGFKGGPNKRTGASGENTILKVPCGTEVRDVISGIILGDLTEDKQSLTIAYGGKGGHGNAYYLSNQNRAPESFTDGQEGEIWEVQLELKLLAEVGIIGLPNAGKSTLISVLSSARPKIANYPFTTLIPNLGVVRKADGNGCLFADIPGLISGAAEGIGLGHDFLRHIQRTKILIHLIDSISENPIHDFEIIEQELKKYGKGLLDKERIIVINKKELVDVNYLKTITKKLENLSKKKVLVISSSLRDGLSSLLSEVWNRI